MLAIEKDLLHTETSMGVLQGCTFKDWLSQSPTINDIYLDLIEKTISYRGAEPPKGYRRVAKGQAAPVRRHLIAILQALGKSKFEKRFSQTDCLDMLAQEGITVTKMGLTKIFRKYLTLLRIEPPKGRQVTITSVKQAEEIAQREKQSFAKKQAKKAKTAEEVEKAIKEEAGYDEPEFTPEEEQKAAFKDREVIYEPTPKQIEFHQAADTVVLYGGAAGGGKSYALIFDAIRYAHVPGYKAVIIRRTSPELLELIETSSQFYKKLFPGAKFIASKNMWRFPSGAIVRFGYLERKGDELQYQGHEYQYIAFDELGQWIDPWGWNYLKSRLRGTRIDPISGEPIPLQMRATSNPGAAWVKDMFIEAAPPNTTFYDKAGVSHRFIPATLLDNPHLPEEYRQMLESLPEVEKRQLLYGDWNATSLAAFPDFYTGDRYDVDNISGEKTLRCRAHVVEPFEIPKWWNRICGMDYGYRDPATAIWYAINPDNGQKIVYREYNEVGRTGIEFAHDILNIEREHEILPVEHVIDWSIFNKTGYTGPTIGEQIRMAGLPIRPADKNRIAGNVQIHENLRPMHNTNEPGLIIFNTCPRIIKQIQSAQIDEKNPDDIDQRRTGTDDAKHHWDLYDSLRYGLMARPQRQSRAVQMNNLKRESSWNTVNRYFS